MSSPVVTVIIATYNWSAVLPYSIGSVLAQSFRDFELLVIGDGCTDDSERVVSAIDDSRVRWINLPCNTGHQWAANNRALAEARGEFIAYLGHDDLWLPHHLECAIAKLEETGADAAYSIVGIVAPDADTALPFAQPPDAPWCGPPSGTVHRKRMTDAIGGWRDYRDLTLTPDSELLRRAHRAGSRFVAVPRLTAIKFSAAVRPNVYRDKPCHEQAAWLRRIRTDPDFEAHQLAHMVRDERVLREMSVWALLRVIVQELPRRLRWRFSRRSGRTALFWRSRRSGIDAIRKFKGL